MQLKCLMQSAKTANVCLAPSVRTAALCWPERCGAAVQSARCGIRRLWRTEQAVRKWGNPLVVQERAVQGRKQKTQLVVGVSLGVHFTAFNTGLGIYPWNTKGRSLESSARSDSSADRRDIISKLLVWHLLNCITCQPFRCGVLDHVVIQYPLFTHRVYRIIL